MADDLPEKIYRARYVAAPGQTAFRYDWFVYAASDLLVVRVRAGVSTPLQLGTDYTVTGVRVDEGGDVVLVAGAEGGDVYAIVGAQPNNRPAGFGDSGSLRAEALNAEFRRLWIAVGQLNERVSRQVIAPVGDDPALGSLEERGCWRMGRVMRAS